MSGNGKGRGRGWLKLDKNATNRAVGVPNVPSHNTDVILLQDACQPIYQTKGANNYNSELLTQDLNATTLNSQHASYDKLISFIEMTDPADDGIKFNSKLKAIMLFWQQECKSETDVKESFNYVFQKCTQDASLGSKLTTIMSARTFATTEVHGTKIRSIFIDSIQNVLDRGNPQLLSTNPLVFRNTLRMLGEFYHKARLVQGGVRVLAKFITRYLILLLQSNDPLNLELFTSQLYLNGAMISENSNEELQEVTTQIRTTLANSQNLTSTCRFWLILALDIVHYRFGLMPSDLYKYYQQNLGEKAMANFQVVRNALSVQTTHGNKAFDSYQSTVSVLQVTPPESRSPINEQQSTQYNLPPEAVHFNVKPPQPQYRPPTFNTEVGDWNGVIEYKPTMVNQEKAGRPILGAGARLQRIRTNEETNNFVATEQNWENATEWDNCPKVDNNKSWGNGTKGYSGSKNNKGWEHDDRFEKNY